MGAGASTERILPAQDALRLSKQYNLRIAEIFYCYRRYLRLKGLISSKTDKKSRKRTKTSQKQNQNIQDSLTGLSETQETLSNTNNTSAIRDNFIVDRIFQVLFHVDLQDPTTVVKITFDLFLETMVQWRSSSSEEKLSFFFKVLDFDEDNIVGVSDISAFLLCVTGHKFKVGDRVKLRNDVRRGTLKYLGVTKFQSGIWAGIELDMQSGKHNGTVDGVKYFETAPGHGTFVEQRFLELESHYDMSLEIINRFTRGSIGSNEPNPLTFDLFRTKLASEPWIAEKLFFDPFPFHDSTHATQ